MIVEHLLLFFSLRAAGKEMDVGRGNIVAVRERENLRVNEDIDLEKAIVKN
jgi:hypothetical protein